MISDTHFQGASLLLATIYDTRVKEQHIILPSPAFPDFELRTP